MDDYLSKIKKNEESTKKPNEVKKVLKIDENKAEEKTKNQEKETKKPKSIFKKLMDFITGEEEMQDEDIETEEDKKAEEIEEKIEAQPEKRDIEKKSFFGKIKSWFSSDDDLKEEEIEKKTEAMLPDDLKNILKIQNKWLGKLPKETLHEFKNSEDYKNYKETLKKYNLIK